MKNDVVVAVLASAVGLLGAVLISAALFWVIKSRRKSRLVPVVMKRRRFSYLEVVKMTDNFRHVVGRGGFGNVYRGDFDGAPVAVKLYRGNYRAAEAFETEANYVNKVYHKNLINLVGYCDESTNLALVFEFMVNGDLRRNLTGSGSMNLTWERRLRIGIGVSKALDYLHQGCDPPIIHRDIKSSNILLSHNFEAKLFEFSLAVDLVSTNDDDDNDDEHHVAIGEIAGTHGYLDPEYVATGKLTTGSDVYGFGVVLMEIVTGKLAYNLVEDHHLTHWVSSMFGNGEIEDIVDPKLEGEFDINSAEEVLKIALTCVSENTHDRPTMDQVILSLKNCLQMERARSNGLVSSHYFD